jgi:hypothetical protein
MTIDGDGTLGQQDLPLVAKVADQAMVWIYENSAGTEM